MGGSIVFARRRQCTLPCGHIGATWRIQLNLCFLWPTPVHNPNGKIDRFSHFSTTHGSVVRYIGANWRIRLNSCFLWPTQVHNPNGKSIGSAVSAQLHSLRHKVPILYNGRPFPQNCPLPSGIWTPSNTRFNWAHSSPKSKRHLDRFSNFAQMTAECLLYNRTPLHQHCPFPMGDLDPHLTHSSLGPPKSSTQTASRSVKPFLQGSLV